MKFFRLAAIAAVVFPVVSANAQTTQQETLSAAQAIAIVGGTGGGGGTARSRVETVPNVIPPSMQGANPCNIGASGGAGWMGFGASAAVLAESTRCRGQEWFRFQMMAGNAAAAQAIACRTDSDMRQAYLDVGQPCPQDRPAGTPSNVPPAPTNVSAAPTAAIPQNNWRAADWCDNASPSERGDNWRRNCVNPSAPPANLRRRG